MTTKTRRSIPTADVRPGHTIWSAPFHCPVHVVKVGHRASDQTAIFVYYMETAGRTRECRIERKLNGKTTIFENAPEVRVTSVVA